MTFRSVARSTCLRRTVNKHRQVTLPVIQPNSLSMLTDLPRRWGPDRRRTGPRLFATLARSVNELIVVARWGHVPMLIHSRGASRLSTLRRRYIPSGGVPVSRELTGEKMVD